MFLVFRLIRRAVSTVVLLVVVAIGSSAGWVLWHALREDLAHTDAIVVLGAAQFDGTPSPVLANRLDRAYALYERGVADRIVTVGGSRPGDRYTEATAGRRYLHERGIAWDRMKAVKTGSDTYESVRAVADYATAQGWRSVTIVTDRLHAARASTMMRSFGFAVHAASPTGGPGSAITWSYLVRETGGLLRFWLITQRGT